MLGAMLYWCFLDRPIPGPASKWIDHLPYGGRKANSTLSKLIEMELVIETSDGFLPNHDKIQETLTSKPVRKRRSPSKVKKEREITMELSEYFSSLTNIEVPILGKTMSGGTATVLWWRPLNEMLAKCDGDIGECKRIMKESIRDLISSEMSINSPKSIRRVFTSTKARAIKRPSVW